MRQSINMNFVKDIECRRGKNGLSNSILLKIKDRFYSLYELKHTLIKKNRLTKLKNLYSGKRCFIIGNGPSLGYDDLQKLKKEITFGSNGIYLAKKYWNFEPTYYVVNDVNYLRNHYGEIMNVDSTKIFNFAGRILLKNSQANKIFLYREIPYNDHYSKERDFSLNPSIRIYGGATVIYVQIQLAIYMGFKEIYLIGVDFDYGELSNLKIVNEESFIASKSNKKYFVDNYLKEGLVYNIPRLDDHRNSFIHAKIICDKLGVKIYNASRKTKLDVFEMVDFDLLFN